MSNPKKQFNFQESFSELEKIVAEFEKGELELDASLVKFERGLKLAAELKERLNEVENKVVEIKKKFAAEPDELPTQE